MKKNNDYIIQLGLDSSQVEKKYKKVIQTLTKDSKALNKITEQQCIISEKNLDTQLKLIRAQRLRITLARSLNDLESKPKETSSKPLPPKKPKEIPSKPQSAPSTAPKKPNKVIGDRDRERFDANLEYEITKGRTPGGDEFNKELKRYRANIRQLKKELSDATSVREVTLLRKRFSDLKKEIGAATRAQTKLNNKLTGMQSITSKMMKGGGPLALLGLSAYGAVNAAKAIYTVGRGFDAMQASLLAASDSAEAAKDNFLFLQDLSQNLGAPLESGVKGFNRLGIAMKGAGFQAGEIKEVYTSMQEAVVTAQLTEEKANLVMLAVSQIASKGKVSSEELTRQLGEHLPFALNAAKDAMGVTTSELFDMMKKGELLSENFLLPFAKQISLQVRKNNALTAATKKLTSEQNRFNNALKIMINQSFQKGGMSKFFGKIFKGLADLVGYFEPLTTTLSIFTSTVLGSMWEVLVAIFDIAEDVVSTLANLIGFKTGSGFLDMLNIALLDADNNINKVLLGFYKLKGFLEKYGILGTELDSGKSSDTSNWFTRGVKAKLDFQSDDNLPFEDMRAKLRASMNGSSNSSTTTIGDIHVTSNSSDPKKVADEVMYRFSTELGSFQ